MVAISPITPKTAKEQKLHHKCLYHRDLSPLHESATRDNFEGRRKNVALTSWEEANGFKKLGTGAPTVQEARNGSFVTD